MGYVQMEHCAIDLSQVYKRNQFINSPLKSNQLKFILK
jgi:hypothetical protein